MEEVKLITDGEPLNKKKYACYVMTSNCYEFCEASIKSLLLNSSVDEIFIVHNEEKFSMKHVPIEITPIGINIDDYINIVGPNNATRFTRMVLARLALHKILPKKVDVVLSLDYDVLINHDIDDLWDIPLENNHCLLAGVPERDRTIRCQRGYFEGDEFVVSGENFWISETYVNAGLLLLNMKAYREEGIGDMMLHDINHEYYHFPEQDLYNTYAKDRMILLPTTYNSCRLTGLIGAPKVKHYAAEEKKLDKPLVQRYLNIDWKTITMHRKLKYGK